MKLFILDIFKCKRCPFTENVSINIDDYIEEEYTHDLSLIKDNVEPDRKKILLKKLQKDFSFITDEDIENWENSEAVRRLFFGITVINGCLKCDKCQLIYPITNSILDTVDCIEGKDNLE